MSKLILVRHGQSVWNKQNIFTGWVDVPLSEKGMREARSAGRRIAGTLTRIDVAYVSHLRRAKETLFLMLSQFKADKRTPIIYHHADKSIYLREKHAAGKNNELPIFESVALAERYYGKLQGQNKAALAKKVGKEQVHIWRRSYDVAPPGGECLKDTAARAIPYFKKHVLKDLRAGKNVLIAAHGNSLRALIMHIEGISKKDIPHLEVPTGIPIVYTFDKNLKIKKKQVLRK